MSSAAIPVTGAAASGVNGSASRRTSSTPDANSASRPGAVSPSANSVWTIANSRWASVPGTIAWCSSARRAVSVRRGSTTTSLPPRAFRARRRPGRSGAVNRLPVDVRDGDRQARAERVRAGDLFRHLVDAGGREHVRGAERAAEDEVVERARQVVDVGVAQVQADRVRPVLRDDRAKLGVDELERLLPRRLAVDAVGAADERPPEDVGVAFEIHE